MSITRSAAVAFLIAASASLVPLPDSPTAVAGGCTAYQPGERTPERRQLMVNLNAGLAGSAYAGQQLRVKKLWMACDYTRVQLGPRGRGQAVEVLMVKVNGEWKVAMIADPSAGPAAPQFRAQHADIPDVLTYW